ncbi:uncharacterized protein N0V89_003640 [Didymosphaeria variabile]|uniref:Heterokaryon incompatibility domain-containing protein n=1 Tax=Didymosphaeria variabile TaxID=1932322 RepID=A0A9W8XN03_9PLEO|nr:uncharacterized protein N0V89_003640 [Didymosphaeria variabile]KAJ4355620.1 hypothetical protein N0V89_003640 [Didymosphaeria variabile]
MRLININKDKDEGPKLEDFTFRMHKRPDYSQAFSLIYCDTGLSQDDHGGDVTFTEFNDSKDKLKQAAAIEDREKRKDEIEKLGLRTAAFDKLLQAIKLASDEGATHIWIDSCCINRDNSSELTEALNSMYRYYEEATKCLVYLHDFEGPSKPHDKKVSVESYDFSKSEWFTRGWTLQELIAPKEVIFYNHNWHSFGRRSEKAVAKAICKITKIPEEVLNGKAQPYEYSVAQRTSWAANRNTTRGEDKCYSLFGLFDVNLTLIYGEGAQKAFLRLQEAIMSSTNDMSLFAWESTDTEEEYRGALARSPQEFRHAGELVHRRFLGPNPEFSMTNRGLKIMPLLSKRLDGTYFLPLNCAKTKEDSEQSLGIILSKQSENDEQLYRYKPGDLSFFDRAIFTQDYEFWLKQNETPIYIVRDERYLKNTSRESSPSEHSRERESRGNSTSGMAADDSDKAKLTKLVSKRTSSLVGKSKKQALSTSTRKSKAKRSGGSVPSNNTLEPVEAGLTSAAMLAPTLQTGYRN